MSRYPTAKNPVEVQLPTLVLDIIETAQVLRCGRSTVYKLIAAGHLESIQLGRRRLVTYASCEDLVARLAAGEVIAAVDE